MKNSLKLTWMLFLVLALSLASCRPAPADTPSTSQPEAVLTAAAQTAEAQLTDLAQPTATATLTQTPAVTLVPATEIPTDSLSLTPVTGTDPAVTLPPSTSGDLAEYSADITIPDGTEMDPGEAFTKTWRLINSGTTNWTTDYSLAFLGGEQMSTSSAVNLTTTVAPGATVDISVNMVAPDVAGTHQGYWKMQNAVGEFFDFAVYVQIVVGGGGSAASATPGGSGGAGSVSNVTLTIDDDSAEGCPHTFNFTPSFSLTAAATVSYRFEAGSDVAGFTFDLPADQTASFDAGSHTLDPFNLNISNAVNGWVQFHILSPEDEVSGQREFSLTCD